METSLDFSEKDITRMMKQFERLEQNTAKKIGRRAVNAGATPIVSAMRRGAPVLSGTLKRSLGKKTIVYRRNNTAVAIIGARITGKHRGYHAHLVENGHIGPGGKFVPGDPFMARAVQASGGQARDRMFSKLVEGIDQEVARA